MNTFEEVLGYGLVGGLLVSAVLATVTFIAMWKMYRKVGYGGWECLIPVYNTWVLYNIVGLPGWLSLLIYVPLVNCIGSILIFVVLWRLPQYFSRPKWWSVLSLLAPFLVVWAIGFNNSIDYEGR